MPLFEENSGVFPFSELRQQVVTHVDHALRDGHNMFLRGNWTGYDRDNSSFGELNARNRGYYQNLSEFSLAFGDTFVISPRWVSETRLGFAYHDAGSTSYEPNGPSIEIAGFGNFGRDFFLPIRGLERVYQVRQNFIRVTDRQTLKFGADANPVRNWVRSETFLSGRFIFGEAVPLASVIDNAAGTGTSRLIQGALAAAGLGRLAGAVDAPISALQAYVLGLPTVYQQGFGNPYWLGWTNRTNFYVEDAVRITPKFLLTLGLRHELEFKTRFPRDNNNLAPRAGFAWNPNPKTVVRGGYGIFYARIEGQISYINDLLGEKQQIHQVFIPLTGAPGIRSALTGGTADLGGDLPNPAGERDSGPETDSRGRPGHSRYSTRPELPPSRRVSRRGRRGKSLLTAGKLGSPAASRRLCVVRGLQLQPRPAYHSAPRGQRVPGRNQ